MEHSTPIRTLSSSNNNALGMDDEFEDEIDVESLRQVFGTEDLDKRKAHELRELWSTKTKSRMPRFLLDPKNKDHVAPHAVALRLLLKRTNGLYKRVPRSDSETQHNENSHGDNESYHSTKEHNTKEFGVIVHVLAVLLAIVVLLCQFTLEVLGGAGAIWGCAEIARLRKGGPVDPSWDFFTYMAIGVGMACLVRFLLVHPFVPKPTDPTFVQKYRTQNAFQLLRAVASDPVLFLHPNRCCGCTCVCCGSHFQINESCQTPGSIHKASPQRRTWDLSDDESDDGPV